jgi:hypothetical protein
MFFSGDAVTSTSKPIATTQPAPASKIIPNVPPLAWGQMQDTTYVGALVAAMRGAGEKQADYVTFMGDSGLAFRLRWWRATGRPGWDPSSPVGEMGPWVDLASESTGWDIRWETHLDGKTDMSRYKDDVVSSINSGVPVLAYFRNMDMAVIYGYDAGGDVVLFRDYSADGKLPLAQNQGLLAFLKHRAEAPPRKESILKGLQQAVDDWYGKTQEDQPRKDGPGTYFVGSKAYDVWMDDLNAVGQLSAEQRKPMFHPNFWTFDILTDARAAAAKYLRESAPFLPADAQPALLRAADDYDRAATLMGQAISEKKLFFGPPSGRSLDQWTDDIRRREHEVLGQLRALDTEAIQEIESVLSSKP